MKTKEIIDQYYKGIEKQKQLYYEGATMGGFFNYEKIEIGISGPDERIFLNKLMGDFNKLINNKGIDYLKNTSVNSKGNIYEDIKDGLRYAQILYHESLHVLQTFNLQACNEHIYWIRNFRDLDFTIFSLNILYNGEKWSIGDNIMCDKIKERIIEKEPWIQDQIEKYGNLFNQICQNFTDIKTHPLSTIHLIEGEAFSFQKLTTGSEGENIFLSSDDTIYTKAFNYFILQLETKYDKDEFELHLIFILICHLSLKFGSSRYIDNKYTASAIFEYLCLAINKYIKEFRSVLISQNNIDNNNDWLQKNGYNTILDNIQKNNFVKYSILVDRIESDVLNYFREFIFSSSYMKGKENIFYKKTVQHFDRKMKPMFDYFNQKHAGFTSKYYLPLLIAGNNNVLSSFSNSIRDVELLDIEIKSPNNRLISIEQDNYLFQLMSDFQDLIKTGRAYCCEEHGIPDKKRIIKYCNNADSLRNRIKKLFGQEIELENLIKQS